MKQKYYKKNKILDIDENFNFVEEVPENQVPVYDFEDPKKDKKVNILILIILLLSLSLFGGGLYYAFIKPNPKQMINFDLGDLFIVQSSVEFGDTIDSFLKHLSEETAAEYTFYVKNDNSEGINYRVKLVEKKQLFKNEIDISMLNYSLIKNNKEVSYGKIKKLKSGILVTTKVEKESTDYFVVRVWSDYPSDKYYKYEISVIE